MRAEEHEPQLHDVVYTRAIDDSVLFLRFEDGLEGSVNVRDLVRFHGVFEPLADPQYFAQVVVHAELGVPVWPNGADLDPVMLYEYVENKARLAG